MLSIDMKTQLPVFMPAPQQEHLWNHQKLCSPTSFGKVLWPNHNFVLLQSVPHSRWVRRTLHWLLLGITRSKHARATSRRCTSAEHPGGGQAGKVGRAQRLHTPGTNPQPRCAQTNPHTPRMNQAAAANQRGAGKAKLGWAKRAGLCTKRPAMPQW